METLEELVGGPKDHAHIIKGKRTKRQRLQSPIPFSIATPNSSSGDGDNNYSSNEFAESGTTEEEEEDMVANCLILLALGRSIDPKSSNPGNPRDHENRTGFRYTSKRFLEAPSTTGGGKVGMFVYQCKTCDRSFPSFQALGGHRASHKRLKPAPVEVKRKKMLLLSDDDEEEQGEIKDHVSSSLSLQLINRPNCLPKASAKVHECSVCGAEFVSGQALGGHMRCHRASGGTNTTLSLSPLSPIGFEYEDREAKKQRAVFSLSPIGCEYEDREAKKQRSVLSLRPIGCEYEDWEAKKQRSVLSLSPIVGESEDQDQAKKQRILVSLDLDLNLPAPVEDQVEESKYTFASKQQPPQQQQQQQPPQQQQHQQQLQPQKQSPLVLPTAPTLVDCQY